MPLEKNQIHLQMVKRELLLCCVDIESCALFDVELDGGLAATLCPPRQCLDEASI